MIMFCLMVLIAGSTALSKTFTAFKTVYKDSAGDCRGLKKMFGIGRKVDKNDRK